MYKKTITYEDYNGESRTEDFFFNLTKAELAELNLSVDGGYASYIERIVAAKDIPTLSKIFKELVLMSYGEKSADGKRFVKNRDGHRLADDFVETEAYSELYIELVSNTDAASEFVNNIIPKNLDRSGDTSKHPALKG